MSAVKYCILCSVEPREDVEVEEALLAVSVCLRKRREGAFKISRLAYSPELSLSLCTTVVTLDPWPRR